MRNEKGVYRRREGYASFPVRRLADVVEFTALALLLSSCSATPPAKKEAVAAPAYFKVDAASAGTVLGKVTFSGKARPGKKVDMDEDPQCASLHKTPWLDEPVSAARDGSLANVFVYVKQGLEGKMFEAPRQPAAIDQKGCWFAPRVVGIQTGQTLDVTNSDPVTHNIHPRAHINREWNQSQGPGSEPLARKFIAPEVMIRVKCNIHSWMHAWIGVVDHPYFAVTGKDGAFELRNLPPGTYTIEAWQEELGTEQQQVTVAPQGRQQIAFKFQGESK